MGINISDLDSLSGKQKVAILLLTMSPENATKIFSLMNEAQMAEISYVMSNLGVVSGEVVKKVTDDLNKELITRDMYLGNIDTTEKLLSMVLDKDKVAELLDNIRGPRGKNTWEKLKNVDEDLLALYFRNEHPQTAALILSKMPPDHSAKVIQSLPDDFAFEIMWRILNIGNVDKHVLEKVEHVLRAEFITSFGRMQKRDSCEMLAEIFNNLDRTDENKFMSMLESKLPEAASKVRDKMFTFDDIVRLDNAGIQRLIKEIDISKIALALKGANSDIKNLIFSNMSQRIVKIITDDMDNMGPVRVRDVDNVRLEIVAVAKDLISRGEINMFNNTDDKFIT